MRRPLRCKAGSDGDVLSTKLGFGESVPKRAKMRIVLQCLCKVGVLREEATSVILNAPRYDGAVGRALGQRQTVLRQNR